MVTLRPHRFAVYQLDVRTDLARIKYIELTATTSMGLPSRADHDLSLVSACPQRFVVSRSDLRCSIVRKL